jgi:acyl-CoA synthetase (AMP-forming)/AMP-acid ligase II
MIDTVATHGKARGDAIAIVDLSSDKQWSWRAFDAVVNRVAHYLIATLGPASGERVGTCAKNGVEMIILQFACMRAGAIFVPFNWRLAPAEINGLMVDEAGEVVTMGEVGELWLKGPSITRGYWNQRAKILTVIISSLIARRICTYPAVKMSIPPKWRPLSPNYRAPPIAPPTLAHTKTPTAFAASIHFSGLMSGKSDSNNILCVNWVFA